MLSSLRSLETQRAVVAAIALLFLVATTPLPNTVYTDACEQCHPGIGAVHCAFLVAEATQNCCHTAGGSAWCFSAIDGFAVACEGGWGCTCDENGEYCLLVE